MMIKAVLFDLDGVLVDSEVHSTKASDQVLADVGIYLTDDERKLVYGRRTIDNYKRHIKNRGLDLDPDELLSRKTQVYKKLIKGKLEPLPGAIELVKKLKESKIKICVVSSSTLERVEASLNEVGLLWEFPVIISGNCCSKGKPDPEPFIIASEKLQVKPKECLVIEDAEAGIKAAKSAEMRCIAVESPNTHGQDLSNADLIVNSLEEITLESINKV